MIRGLLRDELPFIRAVVSLPARASAAAAVDLLVDTGSHLSVLAASVLEQLGLDPVTDLPTARRVRVVGAAGSGEYVRVRVLLSFPDADPARRPYPAWVAVPAVRSDPVPSIFGMESLADFRLVVSPAEKRVELEPLF